MFYYDVFIESNVMCLTSALLHFRLFVSFTFSSVSLPEKVLHNIGNNNYYYTQFKADTKQAAALAWQKS